MKTEKRAAFLGTYFNKDAVLRLAQVLKIVAWIALGICSLRLLLALGVNLLQILRGFWVGMGFTDVVQNFLYAFEQPLQGGIFAFLLLGLSHLLLIFLDIEDNTRRAARGVKELD
jgi:hypothetical protein